MGRSTLAGWASVLSGQLVLMWVGLLGLTRDQLSCCTVWEGHSFHAGQYGAPGPFGCTAVHGGWGTFVRAELPRLGGQCSNEQGLPGTVGTSAGQFTTLKYSHEAWASPTSSHSHADHFVRIHNLDCCQ